jgi:hypothetical protein
MYMQIGRKLYYELETGTVIQDAGEREGHVIETTTEEDFATFPSLIGCNRSAVGVIELPFGRYAKSFRTCFGYRVDLAKKKIIFEFIQPTLKTEAELKQERITALQAELAALQAK